MSSEPQAGSSDDVFVDRLTELLDAHVVRPRPAADEALSDQPRPEEPPADEPGAGTDAGTGEGSDEDARDVGATARGSTAATGVPAALLAALGAESTWAEPPAGLRDAVLARVLGSPAGEGLAVPPAPGATAEPGPRLVPRPDAADTDTEHDTDADDTDAAAAADAGRTEPDEDDEPELAAVHELRPRWLRLRYAVPLAAAAAAVFTVAVLGVQQALAPEEDGGVTFAAVGTQFAPAASGTVTVSRAPAGFRVVIDVHDLPGAEPGSYYIAWLRGPDGVVPLGSFHARQVAKPITLWSGVDPADYPRFSVTLQREGAPPTPSGVTVMSGELSRR